MSGLITIKINPSGLLHTLFSQPLKQRTFLTSMHLAVHHTEARPAQEYLLFASNKVLSSSGCSKGMAREKETEEDSERLQREKRTPAAKPLTARATAGSLITDSGLSTIQLKDWIFLFWEELYRCVIWRKQTSKQCHMDTAYIFLLIYFRHFRYPSDTLQFFPPDISAICRVHACCEDFPSVLSLTFFLNTCLLSSQDVLHRLT